MSLPVVRYSKIFQSYRRYRLSLLFRLQWWIILIFLYIPANAQPGHLVPPTDDVLLRALSDSLATKFKAEYESSLNLARQLGISSEFISKEGVVYALQGFELGFPLYYQTLNQGGAITSGARDLHFGGSKLLNTTGKGITAGVWDAGMIYTNHQEFGSRVINVNQARDFSDHATHVAGSISSGGIEKAAKGMAFESKVRGFDWNNDMSEMAAEAASGLIFSNHSYGFSLGWARVNGAWRWMGDSDAQEDYRFGFYGSKSQTLDQIAFNAPNYLIVWAAGNDRNDLGDGSRPPDGPYDCIGPEGVAKNVLTIGAVYGISGGYQRPSDVVMTDFSSWGPADDGRVKPDLVTKGHNVYSTSLNGTYSGKSGTSMATPIATGSLMLVQEFYHGISRGKYLTSASVKGLAILTANQTGISPGPDYSFGWGLLNVGKMIDFLMHRNDDRLHFLESQLTNQSTYEYEFYSDGEEPVTASLSWTDRPGVPVAPQLNPRDLMLVNDLDMRIIHEGGEEYYPWILDPAFPAAEANKGDNFRDNVEKIFINNPPPGNYRLIITHKGTLAGGRQDFSLFVQNGHLPQKKHLYWIGGGGDWHDPSNWSFSSGGSSAGIIPDAEHRAVLDRHSFSAEDQHVKLTELANAYSLTIRHNTKGNIDFNGQTLRVISSLHAEKNFSKEGAKANLLFIGEQKNSYIYSVESENQQLPNMSLVFDNRYGGWQFVSDLSAERIQVRQGSLDFLDVNVDVKELIVDGRPSIREIHPGEAVFSGLQKVDFPDLRFSFNGGDATFIFESGKYNDTVPAIFNTGVGASIGRLINKGKLHINNPLYSGGLKNDGEIHLFHDIESDFVSFSDSANFYLHNQAKMTVHSGLSGTGSPENLVGFTGLGSNNGIVGTINRVFCLDYISVRNMPASGQSVFNAGLNSTVKNSTGWLTMHCDQVLMADFSFTSPCRYSWTFFKDQSTGQADTWEWQFGDLGTSSDQDPVFTFSQTGLHWVDLTVSSPHHFSSTRKPIVIYNNPLPEITIFIQDSIYFVGPSGYHYQWYRDGKPIEGATKQTFDNSENIGGVYTVLISNSMCNRPSSNQIVVGTNDIEYYTPSMHIYPNPARDHVWIELEDNILHEVRLFDLSGRKLLFHIPESQSYKLDISGLPPGTYILRVMSGGNIINQKLQVW